MRCATQILRKEKTLKMDIRNLVIDAEKTLGGTLMLVDVMPYYLYDINGARTNNVAGYKYMVACPKLALDKVSIKIEGEQRLDKPVNDYPTVVFSDLELSLYWSKQGYQVSAKAKDIMLADN